MKLFFFAAALTATTLPAIAAQAYLAPDSNVIRPINTAIMARNCPNALSMMKAGVKAKQPDALLLGGTMFENGTCMKADWDKAQTLYLMADKAGNFSGVPRLMAGFARSGRENGLALWWAAKRGYSLGKACDSGVDPDDTDAFNAKLEGMAPEVFRACVYSAGVFGETIAQGHFPQESVNHGISGSVRMTFKPALGVIEWEQHELNVDERQSYGVRDLALAELEDPRAIKKSLVTYLKAKGLYALSRYQKPDSGFDPDTVLRHEFVFTLHD